MWGHAGMRSHSGYPKSVEFEEISWEQSPPGLTHRDVCDVAVDSRDRVFLLTRMEARVVIYERDGTFVKSWGDDILSPRPHGITIGPDGAVYCVDEEDQTIRKFTEDGQELAVMGLSGVASDTGFDWSIKDFKDRVASIKCGAPPFNRPTNLAVAPNGDLYVSDGYGNARVHHFSAQGDLIRSWGEPGIAPGEFHVPHGLVVHDGRLLVADRENDRIQVFTMDGEFVEEWTDIYRPTAIAIDREGRILVTELGSGPNHHSWVHGTIASARPGRLSLLDERGRVLQRTGDRGAPCAPGNMAAPHGVAVDSEGSVYIANVVGSHLGGRLSAGEDLPDLDHCHTIQKLVPL